MISIADQSKDFAIAERTTSGVFVPQTVIAKADSSRVAIAFQCYGVQAIAVSTVLANLALNKGFLVPINSLPLTFLFRDWGALVTSTWFGNNSDATTFLQICEVFYRPQGGEEVVILPREFP